MNALTPPNVPTRRSGSHVVDMSLHHEPGLIDLMAITWQNRWLVIACLALSAAMGGMVTAFSERPYAYTTTIEIGTVQRQDAASAIEPSESVLAKIDNAFLPAIEQAHGSAIAEPGFTVNLKVKNPRGTGLLILSSKGPEARQADHIAIQQQVAARIIEEHRRHIDLMRTTLRLEIEEARRSASAMKSKSSTLAMRRDLIQQKKELTTRRLHEIDNEMARISSNREQAGKSLTNQEQVLTVMMLDLQVMRERDRRDELQRELIVGLAEEGEALARDEVDFRRDEQNQQGRIAGIEARLANLSQTRIIGEPQRSQSPVGIGGAVIMAIALGVGLLFSVGFTLLVRGLRQQARFASSATTL